MLNNSQIYGSWCVQGKIQVDKSDESWFYDKRLQNNLPQTQGPHLVKHLK